MRGWMGLLGVGCTGTTFPHTADSGSPSPTLEIRTTWTAADPMGRVAVTPDVTGDGVPDAFVHDTSYDLWLVPGPLDVDKDLSVEAIPLGGVADYGVPGDVDGDGIGDLWVRRPAVLSPEWVRGPITAPPAFLPGPAIGVDELVAYVDAVGDVDGDGDPDLVGVVTSLTTGKTLRVAAWAAPFGPAELATPLFEVTDCDTDPYDYGTWTPEVVGPHALGPTAPALSLRNTNGGPSCQQYVLDATARGRIDPVAGDPALAASDHAPIPVADFDADGIGDFLEERPRASLALWKGPRTVDATGAVSSVSLGDNVATWATEILQGRGRVVAWDGPDRTLVRVEQVAFGVPEHRLELLASGVSDLVVAPEVVRETWQAPELGLLVLGQVVDLDGDGREELFVGTAGGIRRLARP